MRPQLESFAEGLKALGKRSATIESYCRDARLFLDFIDESRISFSEVCPDTLALYQNHLQNNLGIKENSIRRKVISVRQFFRFLRSDTKVKTEGLDEAIIPQRVEIRPRKVTLAMIERLFTLIRAGNNPLKSTRDALILSLLAFEGLKASELIAVCWPDVLDGDHLRIRGVKPRTITLGEETSKRLTDYKDAYRGSNYFQEKQKVRAKEPLIVGFKGKEVLTPHAGVTRHGLKHLLYTLGSEGKMVGLNAEALRGFAMRYLVSRGFHQDEILVHLGLHRADRLARNTAQ